MKNPLVAIPTLAPRLYRSSPILLMLLLSPLALAQAPTVTSISATSGPAAGGTSVTITGTGFTTNENAVYFGSIPATATCLVQSSTTEICTAPAGQGIVSVSVWNVNGMGYLNASYTYTGSGTVYYVSTTGSDSNSGSSSSPWATLQHAENQASAGSTIIVENGTYQEADSWLNGGSAGSPITVEAQTKWQAIIAPTAAQEAANSDGVIYVNVSYVTVLGLNIKGDSGGNATEGIKFQYNYDGPTLVGGIIKDSQISSIGLANCGGGSPILDGQSNTVIDSNLIYNYGYNSASCNLYEGIYINNGSGAIITNNVIGDSPDETGISLNFETATTGFPVNVTIANNTIFNTGGNGIYINCTGGVCSGNFVNNNILYNVGNTTNNASIALVLNGGGSGGSYGANTYSNNLIYDSQPTYTASGITGQSFVNTVATNPDFVNYTGTNTGDYHITSGSGAIGVATSMGAPNHDFAGNLRPSPDGLYDIGAYEFSSGTAPTTPPPAPNPPTGLTATVN